MERRFQRTGCVGKELVGQVLTHRRLFHHDFQYISVLTEVMEVICPKLRMSLESYTMLLRTPEEQLFRTA